MKESKHTIEQHNCIFYEPFIDEQNVRRNNGIPAHVTFTQGTGLFAYHIANPSTIGYGEFFSGDMALTGDITVEMLIKPDSYGYGCGDSSRILYNGEFQVGLLGGVGNKHVFVSSNGSDFVDSGEESIELDVWTHVIVTRQSDGTCNIYINGVLSGGSDQDSGTPEVADEDFVINDINFCYSGYIDYVRIFNYEWTAEEAENACVRARHKDLMPIIDGRHYEYPITAFADYAATIDGATQVTQGQDITNMLPLGEELVTNGSFDADSDWDKEAAWAIVDGKAVYDDTAIQYIKQSFSITAGKYYLVSFDISDASGNAIMAFTKGSGASIFPVGSSWSGYTGFANGSHKFVARSQQTTTDPRIYGNTGGSSFKLDNFSVKEIEVLGDNLVTNGNFTTTDDWTLQNEGCEISGGVLSFLGGIQTYARQSIGWAQESGTWLVKFTMSNYIAGTVRIQAGYNPTIESDEMSGNGTYTVLINGTPNSNIFYIRGFDVPEFDIDNVSVHKLTVTKEIAASTNYTGTHYVLPEVGEDLDSFIIPVDYVAEAIVAQILRISELADLQDRTMLIHVDSQSGSIYDKVGNTLTNTYVTVFKDGEIYAMRFNGSTSLLQPSENVDVMTISFWIKPYNKNQSIMDLGAGNTISIVNGTLRATDSDYLFVNGKPGTTIKTGMWNFVVWRVDTAVTTNSLEIGNIHPNHVNGLMSDIRFNSGLLSNLEVSQEYSANKHKYGL